MKPVRWGVLGAAQFAQQHMARAIHAAEGADFVALATSSPEKAKPFQAFQPNLRVHGTYEALLADPGIDAIYIPLPNHLHVEWTLKAIAAGKHVLTEKPIAMDASDIDQLIAARDAAGVEVAEAYMIVHHPQWLRAKELYQSGAIGQLLHVDGMFTYDNSSDAGNIRNRSETGGGGVPDIGVYTYGATRWLTGEEPLEITYADIDFENEVDVVARVNARFPSFSASWLNSMRMHPFQEMTFVGRDGVMKLTAPFNPSVYATARLQIHSNADAPKARINEQFPGANQYVLQVEAFSRAVSGEAPFAWTLEDAKGTQSVIDAVFVKAAAAT